MDAARWDAACDIAVRSGHHPAGAAGHGKPARRASRRRSLSFRRNARNSRPRRFYRYFADSGIDDQQLAQLAAPFVADDHEPWHRMAAEEAARRQAQTGEKQENAADSPAPAAGEAGKNGTDMPMPDEARKAKPNHKAHRGLSLDDITEKEAPEQARGVQDNRFADTVNLDRSRDQWKNAALEMGVQLTPISSFGAWKGRTFP